MQTWLSRSWTSIPMYSMAGLPSLVGGAEVYHWAGSQPLIPSTFPARSLTRAGLRGKLPPVSDPVATIRADLLVLGGIVVTMDPARSVLPDGGLAIRDRSIVAVGPPRGDRAHARRPHRRRRRGRPGDPRAHRRPHPHRDDPVSRPRRRPAAARLARASRLAGR